MPLSPAGSKHESPESPPPEPPPERQPRAAGEPGAGLREETRLDPARGAAGPRSPRLGAPARMEEPAPGAIVVRIGIPDLQQTVSARPARPRPRRRPANFRPRGAGGGPGRRGPVPRCPFSPQSPAGTRVGQPPLQRCLSGAPGGPRCGDGARGAAGLGVGVGGSSGWYRHRSLTGIGCGSERPPACGVRAGGTGQGAGVTRRVPLPEPGRLRWGPVQRRGRGRGVQV